MTFAIETNFNGRLNNTSLPYSGGLLPLFEAVSNSIHAIEEAGLSTNKGEISIDILRDTQTILDFKGNPKKRGPDAGANIIGFKIEDNGVGFNEANMKSFITLDSDYKSEKGCRGVGRLLWLKAFKRVNVSSFFENEGGGLKSRVFLFNATHGVIDHKVEDAPSKSTRKTIVHLDGFGDKYREATYKTLQTIANSLFEHCLWYFVRPGGAPHIFIHDDEETINLDKAYEEHMVSSAVNETITIKDSTFDLTHIKLRASSSKSNVVALCASNRLVTEETIDGKIPGLYGHLHDESGNFVYAGYVSSPFLDDRVRSERTGFNIDEQATEMFAQTEISLDDIKERVIAKATSHLSEYLEENKKKGKERVENFVSHKAPRYRPVLARIPADKLYINPNISDKELEFTLHKQLAEIEGKLLIDGHDVMIPKENENYPDYRHRVQEYLKTVEDVKKSALVNYVGHRKVILDLLEKAIRKDKDGKYGREDLIHNLIMPMRADSNCIMPDSYNLWLIDERLAFHDYLASDKSLSSMPITNSTDPQEPDICALNVFDTPLLVSDGSSLPLASIVVIEIKRPMRNDASEGEKSPIEQTLGYLDRIRKGQVQTVSGRPIPESATIPGFCYIICDITPSIQNRCKMHDAIMTSDRLGYFFYNKNYGAYVEVISFDRLVNSAKERNKAFFDKLGLPST